MTTENRRPNPFDPTDERTADQSTPGASGLSGGRDTDVADRENKEDVPRRDRDGNADAALPADDSTLNTQI